jgi:hypothetical protein
MHYNMVVLTSDFYFMTARDLQVLVLNRVRQAVKDFEFTGTQKRVFEECCEKIVNSKDVGYINEDMIVLSTLTAWELAVGQ